MKKFCLSCLWVINFFPLIGVCQVYQSDDQKDIYKTIVMVANAWSQNDLNTLEKYLDKDYVHTDVRGQYLNRAQWLSYVAERKKQGVANPGVSFDDVHIEVQGKWAFVTGINGFSGAAYAGKDNNTKPKKLRFTLVLEKEDNLWKRKMFQATYIDSI